MTSERASVFGAMTGVAAMAALGLVELMRGEALSGLHPYPDDWPAGVIRVSGALLLLFAASSLRWPSVAGLALALHWLVAAALVVLAVTTNAGDPLAYVPLAQTVVFTAFAVWLWRGPGAHVVLRIAFGAMLLLFGAIHLTHVDVIAGLIPDYVPGASLWPWITGGVQAVAGLACFIGRGSSTAAITIALMYGAWLPIVHAPRLLASPDSTFEWTFALTALALAGVALAVARPAVAQDLPEDQR
jgi:uncharacterized membrane protein